MKKHLETGPFLKKHLDVLMKVPSVGRESAGGISWDSQDRNEYLALTLGSLHPRSGRILSFHKQECNGLKDMSTLSMIQQYWKSSTGRNTKQRLGAWSCISSRTHFTTTLYHKLPRLAQVGLSAVDAWRPLHFLSDGRDQRQGPSRKRNS